MLLNVAGAVEDYTAAVKNALAIKVSQELSVVEVDRVTIFVTSASVNLAIQVAYPDQNSANAGTNQMAARVSNPSTAGNFLSTSAMPITVQTVVEAPNSGAQSHPTPPTRLGLWPLPGMDADCYAVDCHAADGVSMLRCSESGYRSGLDVI